MNVPNQKLTRAERVASLALPPGQFARLLTRLRSRDPQVLLRWSLCVVAAIIMWAITGAWNPPFGFRTGFTPDRDIVARVAFSVPDPQRTESLRRQRRSETTVFYSNDSRPLRQLREQLKTQLRLIATVESLDGMDRRIWESMLPDKNDSNKNNTNPETLENRPADELEQIELFRQAWSDESMLQGLGDSIDAVFTPWEDHGLIEELAHQPEDGSQISIWVHPFSDESSRRPVAVAETLIRTEIALVTDKLTEQFEPLGITDDASRATAEMVQNWLSRTGVPGTLTLNAKATQGAYQDALAAVPEAQIHYLPGAALCKGGKPLSRTDINLLHREHRRSMELMSSGEVLRRSLADFGMYMALYVLCGFYIVFNHASLLGSIRRFSMFLVLVVATVAVAYLTAADFWRAETIPLILFGMTVSIAYQREFALLSSASVALIVILSLGYSLPEFVIMMAATSAAILFLNDVRSRTKLIYVGLGSAAVVFLTAIGVGTLVGQAFGFSGLTLMLPFMTDGSELHNTFALRLASGATWYATCSLLAGLLMTGLLPFIEKVFDVQTDLSLLELGDAAHPLLQELARRAPGTYNHSINVASLSEAAAEAIGANGLLVRVGAYFHDIGKMLKPNYFVENQGQDNCHESLVPAMSTLVIIAHVKDGADLARQHHLPRSIIDFIEQHHGTTLVEYFFQQATKQAEGDSDTEVDETSYRYPGPKPQTREAGVMMLADVVESASRTLVDPAPARIESLVHELAMKKLLDGQFDECGLTIMDLAIIQDSLVKSLSAVYHARVKYPSTQQSA